MTSGDKCRESGLSPFPVRYLQVETSSACNFRCASCPLSLADYDRPAKFMSADSFIRVLDAFPDVQRVEMQGLGEVFLNPDWQALVEIATARGVAVHTFSNASKLSESVADRVASAGFEVVTLSIDGADEATFQRLRRGGTLAGFRLGVANLVAARAEHGAEMAIGLMSVLGRENYEQAEAILRLAESLAVDRLTLTKLNAMPGPHLLPQLLGPAEIEWLDTLPLVSAIEVIRAYRPWTTEERMACYWPQMMAYVTVDGDITACCNYMDSHARKLGNVFRQSGESIWTGEAYRQFRRALWAGDLPRRCRIC